MTAANDLTGHLSAVTLNHVLFLFFTAPSIKCTLLKTLPELEVVGSALDAC